MPSVISFETRRPRGAPPHRRAPAVRLVISKGDQGAALPRQAAPRPVPGSDPLDLLRAVFDRAH